MSFRLFIGQMYINRADTIDTFESLGFIDPEVTDKSAAQARTQSELNNLQMKGSNYPNYILDDMDQAPVCIMKPSTSMLRKLIMVVASSECKT